MKEFKFFQKTTTGNLDSISTYSGDTLNTASLYAPSLRQDIERVRIEDQERMYAFERRAREESRQMMERERGILRKMSEPLFPRINATKVNPKWWMKIKIGFQELYHFGSVGGVVILATSITVTIIAIISKILNVW